MYILLTINQQLTEVGHRLEIGQAAPLLPVVVLDRRIDLDYVQIRHHKMKAKNVWGSRLNVKIVGHLVKVIMYLNYIMKMRYITVLKWHYRVFGISVSDLTT